MGLRTSTASRLTGGVLSHSRAGRIIDQRQQPALFGDRCACIHRARPAIRLRCSQARLLNSSHPSLRLAGWRRPRQRPRCVSASFTDRKRGHSRFQTLGFLVHPNPAQLTDQLCQLMRLQIRRNGQFACVVAMLALVCVERVSLVIVRLEPLVFSNANVCRQLLSFICQQPPSVRHSQVLLRWKRTKDAQTSAGV